MPEKPSQLARILAAARQAKAEQDRINLEFLEIIRRYNE